MDPFLALANRLYEVVRSNQTCINNWGIYLFDRDFEDEPELRNKIGTIWLCSLFDTLEAQHRHLPAIAAEAKSKDFPTLESAAQQLSNFCVLVGEVLALYSREEQIFLVDLRNQLVHSYLAGRHGTNITIKYFLDGRFVKETIAQSDFNAICRSFGATNSFDEMLQPLVARALDQRLRYWRAVSVFQKDSELLYKQIREKKTFTIKV